MLAVDIAACVVQRLRIQLERFPALDLTGPVIQISGQVQLQLPLTVEQTALGVIESRSGNSQPLTSQPLAIRMILNSPLRESPFNAKDLNRTIQILLVYIFYARVKEIYGWVPQDVERLTPPGRLGVEVTQKSPGLVMVRPSCMTGSRSDRGGT